MPTAIAWPIGVIASIPSPGSNQIVLGPLHLRAYGLMIALGVFAAIEISRRRWLDRGGDPEDISAIAIWAVPAGLIGARIYHVITDWKTYFPDDPWGALRIWNGGLGIPGGILVGLLAGVWVARRRGMRLPPAMDVVAPAMAVAQAIGRLGNWFNQELFGRPTSLPWGLQISPLHRPIGYEQFATFQPTFLYEALWNLALATFLVLLDRRRVVRPGRIFALYIGGYAVGRFLVESLRSDHASLLLGIRVNIWTSVVTVIGIGLYLALTGLRRREGDSDEPYTDGHRFVPAGAAPLEQSGSAPEPGSDAEPGSESDQDGEPGAPVEDEPSVGEERG